MSFLFYATTICQHSWSTICPKRQLSIGNPQPHAATRQQSVTLNLVGALLPTLRHLDHPVLEAALRHPHPGSWDVCGGPPTFVETVMHQAGCPSTKSLCVVLRACKSILPRNNPTTFLPPANRNMKQHGKFVTISIYAYTGTCIYSSGRGCQSMHVHIYIYI